MNLLRRLVRFLLRCLFPQLTFPVQGPSVMRRPPDGRTPVMLNPGRTITDPDEAEALGLTVEARKLRYALPDRSELIGKEVEIKLHPWAIKGPLRGVYLGQGERGLSITVAGGGRYIYAHSDVAAVRPA
ncbi:hypothetical protein ACIPY6_28860 [Streptomyces sp. NPDC090054]|uniref:hypothetical protein n=1 Tax=Streptomyces sp. NPDC090054 TaxID=3365933 RepID=UPI00382EDED5